VRLLTAPDVAGPSEVIIAHLERTESQLSQTQAAVASLRSLLERPAGSRVACSGRVAMREIPAQSSLSPCTEAHSPSLIRPMPSWVNTSLRAQSASMGPSVNTM